MEYHRGDIRYPVWFTGRLHWGPGITPEEVTVVDLSARGAAIETSGQSQADRPLLQIVLSGSRVTLPLEVVDTAEQWYGTTLHVAFAELGHDETAALYATLEGLEGKQQTDVERLASRGSG